MTHHAGGVKATDASGFVVAAKMDLERVFAGSPITRVQLDRHSSKTLCVLRAFEANGDSRIKGVGSRPAPIACVCDRVINFPAVARSHLGFQEKRVEIILVEDLMNI